MSSKSRNPLILLEASRRIELLYTDLQSVASPLRQLAPRGVGRANFQHFRGVELGANNSCDGFRSRFWPPYCGF